MYVLQVEVMFFFQAEFERGRSHVAGISVDEDDGNIGPIPEPDTPDEEW